MGFEIGLLDRFKSIGLSPARQLGRVGKIVTSLTSTVRNLIVDRGRLRRSQPVERYTREDRERIRETRVKSKTQFPPFATTTYYDKRRRGYIDKATGRKIRTDLKDQRLSTFRTRLVQSRLKFNNPDLNKKQLEKKLADIEKRRSRIQMAKENVKNLIKLDQIVTDLDQEIRNLISP